MRTRWTPRSRPKTRAATGAATTSRRRTSLDPGIRRGQAGARPALGLSAGVAAAGRARKPLINVRGEQVASGHGFRDAFASRRCAAVIDGFFEWNTQRAPFWYHRADGGLILLAGLYQDTLEGEHDPRFTILTTRPNKLISIIHDRMPVIIPAARLDDWLTAPPTDAVADRAGARGRADRPRPSRAA